MEDTLSIVRAWLAVQPLIIAAVDVRLYVPRLPEGAALPAIGFFVRGGTSNAHMPPIVDPSVQFDCWASSAIGARAVYTALYETLQGVQGKTVAIAPDTYRILSAVEEVQGQDIQDVEYPNYFRVVAFFRITVQNEGV